MNNDRGVLLGAGDDGLVIQLSDGREVEVPFSYVEDGYLIVSRGGPSHGGTTLAGQTLTFRR